MKSKLKIVIAGLIVIAIFTTGFILFKANLSTAPSKPQVVPTTVPQPTLQDIEAKVTSNFNSKNYSAISVFMQKPNVEITIQSTECCLFSPPDQASNQLTYVEKGIPFDFDQQNSTIQNLKTRNGQLRSAYIGVSKNSTEVVAFFFNSKNEISGITMASNWKVFDYNQPSSSQQLPSPSGSK